MNNLEQLIEALMQNSPVQLVLTGSNGAGKSTFYETYLKQSGLPFVNADDIAKQLGLDEPRGAYKASRIATQQRLELTENRLNFIFETVFSDTGGHKMADFNRARNNGYTVAMTFIGIDSIDLSRARVINRVERGGHDVPDDKIDERFARTLANLALAIEQLDWVLLLDNSLATTPYRPIALFQSGKLLWITTEPMPAWADTLHVGDTSK